MVYVSVIKYLVMDYGYETMVEIIINNKQYYLPLFISIHQYFINCVDTRS